MKSPADWAEMSPAEFLVDLELGFFDAAVGAMKASALEAQTAYEAAHEAGAEEWELERWAEESWEIDAGCHDLGALLLVGLYHWIERCRKRRLRALAPTMRLPTDAGTLVAELGKRVDLSGPRQHGAPVEILRLFANSWKHDVDQASAALVAHLGLDCTREHALQDSEVFQQLAARAGLALDSTRLDLVMRYRELAGEYVVALYGAPIAPRG